MFSKICLLLFAILLMTSEITARELSSNHESKYVDDAREYYTGIVGVVGFINRRLKQNPDLPPTYDDPCCGAQNTTKQADNEAQTHN
ncbi:hypothetical protein QVD17_17177 [Tagetes erecta]|uniref:Secreted protein n=1 Tax=Tagetes erecta TaxID=13708 RepID=A0AAD8P177_TARER|nr:hypothetical protein QVD17_17177 [Tagetes erecta]